MSEHNYSPVNSEIPDLSCSIFPIHPHVIRTLSSHQVDLARLRSAQDVTCTLERERVSHCMNVQVARSWFTFVLQVGPAEVAEQL
jgi:hypothetical protein